eukprot:TRINITY_DN806_c0_g1_i2.p1 TRINITY_DN806_c0_g1~~TRINITY_DN806_c0_g1_i2.p1  ORF type:complete len:628 (+),score=139.15 TRINITY_DN806_c0_g1_i2:28-1911(+)
MLCLALVLATALAFVPLHPPNQKHLHKLHSPNPARFEEPLHAQHLRTLVQDTNAIVSAHPILGNAAFVRLPATVQRAKLPQLPQGAQSPLQLLSSFLTQWNVLGVRKPHQLDQDLLVTASASDPHRPDLLHARFVQHFEGIPFFGCELRLSATRDLSSVQTLTGIHVPHSGSLDTQPRISEARACAAALQHLASAVPKRGEEGSEGTECVVAGTRFYSRKIFTSDPGLQAKDHHQPQLVYEVEASSSHRRFTVLVDAQRAAVLLALPKELGALNRQISQGRLSNVVWREGDPFPTANGVLNLMVNSSQWVYALFLNAIGRDGFDGNGSLMKSVYASTSSSLNCPNAHWDGSKTEYCAGLEAVDVVAHEWGHAYTEYTHGLIYAFQSGALNEAYSDIIGETVQLLFSRAPQGTDVVLRTTAQCTQSRPSSTFVLSFSDTCAGFNVRGGGAPTASISGAELFYTDQHLCASEAPHTALPADLQGGVVAVMRGLCTFAEKQAQAQALNASAVIVVNSAEGYFVPSGVANTIPVVVVSAGDNDILRRGQSSRISATVPASEISTRWLVGEETSLGLINGGINMISHRTDSHSLFFSFCAPHSLQEHCATCGHPNVLHCPAQSRLASICATR